MISVQRATPTTNTCNVSLVLPAQHTNAPCRRPRCAPHAACGPHGLRRRHHPAAPARHAGGADDARKHQPDMASYRKYELYVEVQAPPIEAPCKHWACTTKAPQTQDATPKQLTPSNRWKRANVRRPSDMGCILLMRYMTCKSGGYFAAFCLASTTHLCGHPSAGRSKIHASKQAMPNATTSPYFKKDLEISKHGPLTRHRPSATSLRTLKPGGSQFAASACGQTHCAQAMQCAQDA